jgi:hypothetical protein
VESFFYFIFFLFLLFHFLASNLELPKMMGTSLKGGGMGRAHVVLEE